MMTALTSEKFVAAGTTATEQMVTIRGRRDVRDTAFVLIAKGAA